MATATAPAPTPAGPAPSGPLTPTPGSTHTEPFHYEDTSDRPSPNDAFDDMFPAKEAPTPAPKPSAPAPEPAKAPPEAPKGVPSPVDFDEGLPKEPPARPAPPPSVPTPEPKTNSQLREAYERSKEEIKARDAELAQLRQRAPEPKVATNGDMKKYENEIIDLRGRLTEYETKMKFADYSQSAEYKEQYQAPLESAVKTANDELASFTVTQADGEERQATFADLRPLLTLQPGAAWKHAKEIFGDAAPAIMAYRNKIVELNAKAQGALEEFRTQGAERMKAEQEQMTQAETQAAQERIQAFDTHVGSRAKALPAIYAPEADDPESQKLFDAGKKLTDIGFKGSDSVEDGDLVKIQAEIGARAAAFGPMVLRYRKLEAKLAEAEKKLKSYEKSEPGKGDKDAGVPEVDDGRPSWMRDLDRLPSVR